MAPSSRSSKPGPEPESLSIQESSLFVLLLNAETKDEGEDFLDYSFPADDAELETVVPMKGVLLASCGVMKAAVGEEVMFFVFRGVGSNRNFKVSICRVESWVLCIIFPESARDRVARFFVDEALRLIELRHGQLSTLRGHFGQLDRIFRALSGLWWNVGLGVDEDIDAGRLYASLGVVLWSALAESWRDEIRERIAEWELRWEATVQPSSQGPPPLAHPEGFALFLDHALIGTSLPDLAFEACLRLCYLEGAWGDLSSTHQAPETSNAASVRNANASAAPSMANTALVADDQCDVWCHSLFLLADKSGAAALPSHQYSIIQHGPWLLFMLWRMASAAPEMTAAAPTGAASAAAPSEAAPASEARQHAESGGDPFGIDLCIELLLSLPLPVGCADKVASQAALSTLGGDVVNNNRSKSSPLLGHGASHSKRKSLASLPCLHLRPLRRHKGRRKSATDAADALRVERPRSFLFALELEQPPRSSTAEGLPASGAAVMVPDGSEDQAGRASPGFGMLCEPRFGALCEPRCAARDRLRMPGTASAGHLEPNAAIAADFVRSEARTKSTPAASSGTGGNNPVRGRESGGLWRLCCPEMAARTATRNFHEWAPWGLRSLVAECADLTWLAREHYARRDAWNRAPSKAMTGHVLLNVLRGETSLDKVWEECLDESLCDEEQPQAALQASGVLAAGQAKRTEAVALGSGEAWRFQAGAPFLLTDLAPIISIGTLTGSASQRSWSAISTLQLASETDASARPQHQLHHGVILVDDG